MTITLGGRSDQPQRFAASPVELQYKRNGMDLSRHVPGAGRQSVELFLAHMEDRAWRLSLPGDDIEAIYEFDPLTGEMASLTEIKIYANSHYVTPKPTLHQAVKQIKDDLKVRLVQLKRREQAAGKRSGLRAAWSSTWR